jgi:hypothetical protein
VDTRRVSPVDSVVSIFPQLHYAVNYLLERSTGELPKRSGILLWILHFSGRPDPSGSKRTYLENREVVERFCQWLVVDRKAADHAVSEAKRPLIKRELIEVPHPGRRIYLTPQGKSFAQRMHRKATDQVAKATQDLSAAETELLATTLTKVIETMRRTASVVQPPSDDSVMPGVVG